MSRFKLDAKSSISPVIVIGLWVFCIGYVLFHVYFDLDYSLANMQSGDFLFVVIISLPTFYMTGWYIATKFLQRRQSLIQFGTWWYGVLHIILGYWLLYSSFKGLYLVSITLIGMVMGSYAGSKITHSLSIDSQIKFALSHYAAFLISLHGLGIGSSVSIFPIVLIEPNLFEAQNLYTITIFSALSIIGTSIITITIACIYLIPLMKNTSDVLVRGLVWLWLFGVIFNFVELLVYGIRQINFPLGIFIGIIAGIALWVKYYPKPFDKKKKKNMALKND